MITHHDTTGETRHKPRSSIRPPLVATHRRPAACCFAALLVVVMLMVSACGSQEPAAAQPVPTPGGPIVIAPESELLERPDGTLLEVGDPALDFSYTLADGTTTKLSDLRGQKVLLNFWATWCSPCKVEMPDIERAVQEFGSEGFVVLAVNHGEEAAVIEPFARELGLTFPLIANPSSDIVNGYSAIGLPTSYFINSDGTISFKQIGVMDFDFIAQRIEAMQ